MGRGLMKKWGGEWNCFANVSFQFLLKDENYQCYFCHTPDKLEFGENIVCQGKVSENEKLKIMATLEKYICRAPFLVCIPHLIWGWFASGPTHLYDCIWIVFRVFARRRVCTHWSVWLVCFQGVCTEACMYSLICMIGLFLGCLHGGVYVRIDLYDWFVFRVFARRRVCTLWGNVEYMSHRRTLN